VPPQHALRCDGRFDEEWNLARQERGKGLDDHAAERGLGRTAAAAQELYRAPAAVVEAGTRPARWHAPRVVYFDEADVPDRARRVAIPGGAFAAAPCVVGAQVDRRGTALHACVAI